MGNNQAEKHRQWVETEGGLEHPTHIETLNKPEQKARIKWLKEHVTGTILDVGCNWGYVSNEIGASMGVDINLENIIKARWYFPTIIFEVCDARELVFADNSFDTVVLADILEHIEEAQVWLVLEDAIRIANKKILITLPRKQTTDCALCFKHKWIPNHHSVGNLLAFLTRRAKTIMAGNDGNFTYIEVNK